ncbi:MAG: TIGR03936 family radical SAM-associated protein [Peptoniphilus sp.]|nr:TIGR03936 family radical SAM-associated protein [Peptoniphilus sp.]MDD7363684.1 TIGR03936 family radical SAM-associated protein [Bacillota bacterium]MDY6044069.1 TIGR03936 family radical SAM-associated protein [Peptoniphilus sp.]
MQLRLAFKKMGMIKFISHLDTIRVFTRAIQRAEIPVLWSAGFNPHQKLSIAQPLSVGMESEFEVLDLEVEDDYDIGVLKEAINRELPEGLEVTDVTKDFDPTSVFERIRKTEYRLFFPSKFYPEASVLKDVVEEAMKREEILVGRRKKHKKKRIIVQEDIKPGILSMRWAEEEDGVALYAVLQAGGYGNLRPDRFLKGVFETSDIDIDYIQIRRMKSWDGENREVQL